ncbi:hypothetical protein QZH41_002747 [Actinostola sp. cb2023]|nr:hypothetical protein QZH41_002747 [Actinostola sp. cb2023]
MKNSTEHEECRWENNFFISRDILIALTCFAIVIGLFAALGNGLVLLTIARKSSVRSTHIFFIGSLAMADFSVGFITIPFYSTSSLTWPLLLKNDYFEMVFDFLIFQCLAASTYSLLAVSYDRFVAITSPLTYAVTMTDKRCYRYISLVWFISMLLGSSSFMVNDYNYRPSIYLVVICSAFIIPFCLIAYFYAIIFKIARQQARQIALESISMETMEDPKVEQRQRAKRERKAAMTVAMVIGTFAVCWLPNLVIGVVHFAVSTFSECEAEKTEQFWLATLPFAFLNSAINPVIYTVRQEDLREPLKEMVKSWLGIE